MNKEKVFNYLDTHFADLKQDMSRVMYSQGCYERETDYLTDLLEFLYDTEIITYDESEPYAVKLEQLKKEIYK